MHFKDRVEAGQKLAQALKQFSGKNTVVYALPRGGVVIGAIVAKALHTPLDLIIVRKIGHPFSPEYAVCAVAENDSLICNEEELASIDPVWFKNEVAREQKEAKRRHQVYLDKMKPPRIQGKTAIIVDDGIATGLTMKVAVAEVKQHHPQKIVVAVPIIPCQTADNLTAQVDQVVALDTPSDFLGSVGAYYDNFSQVSDEEVIKLLKTSTHSFNKAAG